MSDRELFDDYNVGYVQELFERFARNPESLPAQWREVFSGHVAELTRSGLLVPDALHRDGTTAPPAVHADAPQAPAAVSAEVSAATRLTAPTPTAAPHAPPPGDRVAERALEYVQGLLPVVARAVALVQAFRDHGHQRALIDPLGSEPPGHPQLDPSFFGTSMEELEQIPASVIMKGTGDETLAHALDRLRDVYCGPIGYEFEHLEDPLKARWLWAQTESGVHSPTPTDQEKVRLLERLTEVEGLETFLHRSYLGQKRFSIEGTDMLVPILDVAIEQAAEDGAQKIIMGMAHRGRLNVLAHTIGVPYEEILSEFEGRAIEGGIFALRMPGTGDVKYHHGATGKHESAAGATLDVTLAPNPSHLEFVNPVVAGMARSQQFPGDERDAIQGTERVVPILIHGDAAFAAEGVVAETLNLARLPGYTVGGTVHIIANNQIGFTTMPAEGRSTRYASDLAKGYDLPILHVNADDPQACLAAARLAMAYRAEFRDDIVIDLVGYRRHGHNEGDEPGYTQPRLYARIQEHPTVRELWARQLVADGVIGDDDAAALVDSVAQRLRDAQDRARELASRRSSSGDEERPVPIPEPEPLRVVPDISLEELQEVNSRALEVPQGFVVHRKLQRQLQRRGQDFGESALVDWGHAEFLAFGSLLREGIPVRLTGQDSQRGTFSHRHLVLHDERTGASHIPLATVGTSRFEVYNSPLTEMAAVGFEYGYSVGAGRDFVLWEAQFGDFVNAAQVMLDQFISAGRTKWGQLSRLTLLLPHGYEGQGPEHSSARIERFLQLCAEDNMRVAYPSTPAQYFHLLRRQAHTLPERPLVIMTPKSLLRHPLATSRVGDLAHGRFLSVLDDEEARGWADEVTRLVLCTGKIYYDLLSSDRRSEATHVALTRMEQLYPFPSEQVRELVSSYPRLQEVVWTQEEPLNMGALTFLGPRLRAVVPRSIALSYVARPERASPAEGNAGDHAREQERLAREALGLGGPAAR